MDEPGTDPVEIVRSFRFIRWINRRMRGVDGLLRHLDDHRADLGESLSLLDVGTGCADIPIAAVEWGRRRGVAIRAVGVDRLQASIDEAKRQVERLASRRADELRRPSSRHDAAAPVSSHTIDLLQADAFEIDRRFEPRSFDLVHAGMFLHHFDEQRIVALLRIMARVARRFVIWNDLSRSAWSRFGVRVLTIGQPRVVRHDAVLSVDKGFLEREVRDLVGRAGLPRARIVHWRWCGRFSAAIPIA